MMWCSEKITTPRIEILLDFVSVGQLAGEQECLDQFAFTTNGETGEFLEPFAWWNIGLSVQPFRQQDCSWEMPRCLIRVRRWISRRSGSFSRRILGIALPAVEASINLFLQTVGVSGVVRLRHLLCQGAQFVGSKRAAGPGLLDKLNNPVLFRARQSPNLFDNLYRCHVSIVNDRSL
jgi:hypothetical protein